MNIIFDNGPIQFSLKSYLVIEKRELCLWMDRLETAASVASG